MKERPVVAVPTRGPATEAPAAHAVLAKAADENFPVASRLLPSRLRPHLLAIYGYARLVDDIGDEVAGDRMALLAWLEGELDRAVAGRASHPLMVRVGTTIEQCGLPTQPFSDLLAANRLDQTVHRYRSFEDLVGYCMLSAAPVGRLVLGVFGQATPERVAWSDDVCNALQVVEHLQDVGEDAGRGRVYLPLADLEAAGCPEEDLVAGSASPALRRVVAEEVVRARGLLAAAVPLCATLPLRQRSAVAGFAAGGMAALDEIERQGFDVLAHRCRPRRSRFVLRWLAVAAAATGARSGAGRPGGSAARAAR
jgi:squalene synthase HpnC